MGSNEIAQQKLWRTEKNAPIPDERFVSWPEVRALVGLSRVAVWEMRRTGAFPQPFRVSRNRIAWKLSELRTWIDSRDRVR